MSVHGKRSAFLSPVQKTSEFIPRLQISTLREENSEDYFDVEQFDDYVVLDTRLEHPSEILTNILITSTLVNIFPLIGALRRDVHFS